MCGSSRSAAAGATDARASPTRRSGRRRRSARRGSDPHPPRSAPRRGVRAALLAPHAAERGRARAADGVTASAGRARIGPSPPTAAHAAQHRVWQGATSGSPQPNGPGASACGAVAFGAPSRRTRPASCEASLPLASLQPLPCPPRLRAGLRRATQRSSRPCPHHGRRPLAARPLRQPSRGVLCAEPATPRAPRRRRHPERLTRASVGLAEGDPEQHRGEPLGARRGQPGAQGARGVPGREGCATHSPSAIRRA